jgi:hypothetical protein
VGLLAREIRHLGPQQALLEIDVREQDLRLDGLPRANAVAATPGVILTLIKPPVAGGRDLRYPCSTFHHWEDNVRAIGLALEALRKVDRYGVTKNGEQYAGWKELEAGSVGEGDPRRGRDLIRDAGGDVKVALFNAHPDHGGEADDFRDVIAARDDLVGPGV